jgi:hypothetical protein
LLQHTQIPRVHTRLWKHGLERVIDGGSADTKKNGERSLRMLLKVAREMGLTPAGFLL